MKTKFYLGIKISKKFSISHLNSISKYFLQFPFHYTKYSNLPNSFSQLLKISILFSYNLKICQTINTRF